MRMIKKIMISMGLAGMLILSGCSLVGEVNNTLEYATTTTEYINTANDFANRVTELSNDAISNEEARKQLENELIAMKEAIQQFNQTEAPAIAEDVHNQIVQANGKLEEGIDMYVNNIENGKLDPAILQDSEIITTINEISNLINQIEKLTN